MATHPGQMASDSFGLLRPTSIVVDAPPEPPADEPVADSATDSTKPTRKMPSLPKPKLSPGALKGAVTALPGRGLSGGIGGRSRGASTLVGLDIQPGYVSAVQVQVNGSVLVRRAAGAPLPPDTVREGEVLDGAALAATLRELFHDSHLDKRVRVGIANQRAVLRTLDLPPITDRKELETAVRFQAEDQVPMPLENAVLDFHALGVIDTPAGPRQRVVVVAAQRDMVERLLVAVREAGLRLEGVDLSAFALIRSLYRPSEVEHEGRVLYLNVGGLTNMAIAEGTVCRFTRVGGGGLESMAIEVAERNSIPLARARELLASVELPDPASSTSPDDFEAAAPVENGDVDVRPAFASGVREIAGEVRNSLDFHRTQGGGGEVSNVVLSGPALQIAGFAQALERELHVSVRPQTVGLVAGEDTGTVSPDHLAVAAGLAVEEAPQ